MSVIIIPGDCREMLATLPDASVQCCVTSPPYYGLRDYGAMNQIGLEPTPDAYVAEMVEVFRGVRRVLREDGTCWLNLGDSYSVKHVGRRDHGAAHPTSRLGPNKDGIPGGTKIEASGNWLVPGTKPKDLLGIPWRVAFALQADGWWLRSSVVWAKPNPMPESVTDRPTSSYEMVFLLTKSERYFYDGDAVAEPSNYPNDDRKSRSSVSDKRLPTDKIAGIRPGSATYATRNLRNVWTVATQPYSSAHFATMPPELAERCIKAGSRPGDTILDPFSGAGTTALVASRLGRSAIGIELNPEYVALSRNRIHDDCPMFSGLGVPA